MLSLALISAINYEVNREVRPCAVAPCTATYAPVLAGDCKQYAAVKLQRLIEAGAKPDEFTIWVVQAPRGLHAVLVQNATGMVLDNLTDRVEPRRIKEWNEGESFKFPCEPCGQTARATALTTEGR